MLQSLSFSSSPLTHNQHQPFRNPFENKVWEVYFSKEVCLFVIIVDYVSACICIRIVVSWLCNNMSIRVHHLLCKLSQTILCKTKQLYFTNNTRHAFSQAFNHAFCYEIIHFNISIEFNTKMEKYIFLSIHSNIMFKCRKLKKWNHVNTLKIKKNSKLICTHIIKIPIETR